MAMNFLDGFFDQNGMWKSKKPDTYYTDQYFNFSAPEAPAPTTSMSVEPIKPPTPSVSVLDAFDIGAEGGGGYKKSGGKERGGDYDYSKLFDVNNIGTTTRGIGAIASGIAGVMNANTTRKYQEKMFDMEKERVDKANARQEKFQTNYEKSKGWN